MNFQEAETYLLALGNEVLTMKLGLENIRALLDALGNPHEKYLKVQVAGTNGKGSVCAFLNSICVAASIRTGMFTSPHLMSITERVKIDGVDISEDDFARCASRVRSVSEELVANGTIGNIPTFFEQTTAIALLAFAEAKVELAILETGLGGRLDATTAANAEIAAITRIDYDHQQYLGETLEEIAAEKAAIIQDGSQVVVGEQVDTAMRVIVERCREVDVGPRLASEVVAKDFDAGPFLDLGGAGFGTTDHRPRRTVSPAVTFVTTQGVYQGIALGLAGRHQIENAKVSILLAECLRDRFTISDEHLMKGLTMARHTGRLEFIGPFLLDGAHNIGGAIALRAFLDEFIRAPITIVFGSMNDKDAGAIVSILFPKASTFIVTRPNNSRAISTDDLFKIVPDDFEPERVSVAQDPSEAIARARKVSRPGTLIVVTGSLYLVGEARKILTNQPSEKLETNN